MCVWRVVETKRASPDGLAFAALVQEVFGTWGFDDADMGA